MSNPGNKRRHRALAGAAPSSDGSIAWKTGSTAADKAIQALQSDHNGVSVQRTKGSVINNGGNMMMGTYPKIGMSLGFLRTVRAEPPNCCIPKKD
jgi:hypothetical protein